MPLFKAIVAAVLAVCWALTAAAEEVRIWTDLEGRTIEARLLSAEGDAVTIRRTDGRVFTFSIERLSPEDRAYVEEQSAASFPAIVMHRRPSEQTIHELIRFADEGRWKAVAERLRSELIKNYSGASPAPHIRDWYLVYRWMDLFQDEPFHRELQPRANAFGEGWPESLRRFAASNRDFSSEFFRLVSPADDTGEVSRILKELYENDPETFQSYRALALAISVVYDRQPPGRWPHHQVSRDLLPRRLPDPTDAFEFFVQSHRGGRLLLSPQSLSAEELRFTVDIVAPFEELRWAQQRVRQGVHVFDRVYYSVEYDDSRFSRTVEEIQYHWEHSDYRLSTILERGGICVDQAYFATQAGKARGLPTLYFSGTGNDAGHAWFGYLRGTTGGWNLDVGRYFLQDEYVTGHALDPQTWEPIRDHDISFMQERFHSSEVYRDSLLHSDFAREFLLMGDHSRALSIAERALEIESRNRDAWDVVFQVKWERDGPDAYEQARRDAADAFSRYPDIEAHHISWLAGSLLARNERETAFDELQRISRKNRSARPDISLAQAAIFLRFSRENDSLEQQIATYRRTLSDLGNHALGMGFYRELARPFFNHLSGNGHVDAARRMIAQTRRTLNPPQGSPLDRELRDMAERVSG